MMLVEQWKQQTDRSFRIAAFGSSNTELSLSNAGRHNWVDWLYINLRQQIGNHITITNLGIGGETTADLLNRVHRDVAPLQPSMAIITIGGNDANVQMPAIEYAERLRQLCGIIASYGAQPVLQTYYCPVYHECLPDFRERFETNMRIVRELAVELSTPLVDQYAFFEPFYRSNPDDYIKLMRDRMHVNHLGNLVMGQYISRCFGLSPLPVPDDLASEFDSLYMQMEALYEQSKIG
jgi:lysophospholipase L1-like esterase